MNIERLEPCTHAIVFLQQITNPKKRLFLLSYNQLQGGHDSTLDLQLLIQNCSFVTHTNPNLTITTTQWGRSEVSC